MAQNRIGEKSVAMIEPHKMEFDLVDRYGRAVRIVLSTLTRRKELIDDLFQETFRIALESLRDGKIREPQKIGAFLTSTAKYVAINHFKSNRANLHLAGQQDQLPHPQRSPFQQLQAKQTAALVKAVIAGLNSKRDRELLYRFYIAQQDRATICQALDMTREHFSRVLYRAKKRFRRQYEKQTQKDERIK